MSTKMQITVPPDDGITYDGQELSDYHPPVLFPDIGKFQDSGMQRDYVRQKIEEIFDADDLCVTDLLAQPSRIRNLVGRIIFGIDVNPDTMREERAQEDLRPDVLAAPIRIKCIEGRAATVAFKLGVVADPRGVTLAGNLSVGTMDDSASVHWNKRLVRRVDKRVDYKADEAVLMLRDAWVCLSQHGEYCRRAKSKRAIERFWKYREMDGTSDRKRVDRHEAVEAPEPPKRGPGRPRKDS